MNNSMSSKTITDWAELNELLDCYSSGWIFRGQAKSHNNLRPSFARAVADSATNLQHLNVVEGRAILSFTSAAHHFLRSQEVASLRTVEMDALTFGERLDWLAIMQHYGVPTRLLDWTESVFAAAYFAVERNWQDDGELWACNVNALRDAAAKSLAFKSPANAPFDGYSDPNELHADIAASPLVQMLEEQPDRRPRNLNWQRWRETIPHSLISVIDVVCEMRQIDVDLLVIENHCLQSVVFPMALRVVTDRIHAQQGWFTVPLDPRIDHHDARSLQGVNIEKLVIPARLKRDFLRKLRAANIGAHALFPGLDGLGRSIDEQIRLELS